MKKDIKTAFDINCLKAQLIDFEESFCFSDSKEIHKKSGLPSNWVSDIRKITRFYGGKIDFRNEKTARYEKKTKTIILPTLVSATFCPSESICREFAHELSHLIQSKFTKINWDPKTLKDAVAYERTAERLSYFITKKYFFHLMKELCISHRNYNSYKSKKEIGWLYDFYLTEGVSLKI